MADEEVCPVCHDPLGDAPKAVQTLCGHIYCADCLLEWLQQAKRCPLCNAEVKPGKQERGRACETVVTDCHRLSRGRLSHLSHAVTRCRRLSVADCPGFASPHTRQLGELAP